MKKIFVFCIILVMSLLVGCDDELATLQTQITSLQTQIQNTSQRPYVYEFSRLLTDNSTLTVSGLPFTPVYIEAHTYTPQAIDNDVRGYAYKLSTTNLTRGNIVLQNGGSGIFYPRNDYPTTKYGFVGLATTVDSNQLVGRISSWNSDGFVISWTSTGSVSSSYHIYVVLVIY